MKNRAICFAITGLLLVSLLALSLLAGMQGYQSLLMATPLSPAPGLSPERLEKFAAEEFLLTYEINKPALVQAVNQRHTVTTVETNAHYAALLGYIQLDGNFFTAAAMDAKQRHTVLNETAAFQIFGGIHIAGKTLKMGGESWIITGVVRDGDTENAKIYIPAGIAGGQASSVIVLMNGTVTEAYAKNALKSIGIHENSFDYINLSRSAGIFGECFAVAWKSALFALLLALVTRVGRELLRKFRFYRTKLSELYFTELLALYRTELLKASGGALLFSGGLAAMLHLSLQILETCLGWQEFTRIAGELTAGDFGHRFIWLRDMQPVCFILFAACVSGIILSLLLSIPRRYRKMGRSTTQRAEALARYGKSELA